uniref:Uncharacterized protein n=1 Tax=Alexandrium monilatum TaxID=311494 RepID=A0A7S4SFX7_9DINO
MPAAERYGGAESRLLAGDFAAGRECVRHEVALHLGDISTGRLDAILRRLLDVDPRTRAFVMLVKHWAQSRRLAGPASGGSFRWTLLAVFVLQHEGVLLPLRDLGAVEGGHGPRDPGSRMPLRGAALPFAASRLLANSGVCWGAVRMKPKG